jgi:hypothetical protein
MGYLIVSGGVGIGTGKHIFDQILEVLAWINADKFTGFHN